MRKILMTSVLMTAALFAANADELLSGPYTFDTTGSVHVKPAMLADGWGMSLGGAWETIINRTVTTGVEADIDIPIVNYPGSGTSQIQLVYGGLRLGALLGSDQVLHALINNTLGVGIVGSETFLIDEVSLAGELNVTRSIRVFAGAGYRYTYGINNDLGLSDSNARGVFFDVGLRYGELNP